jgi:hypothetical protein
MSMNTTSGDTGGGGMGGDEVKKTKAVVRNRSASPEGQSCGRREMRSE